ncbi:MAG: TetR/AcrR family transcriptional regulator [Terriglobales bacterium]
MARRTLAPQQARSRASEERLIQATRHLLQEKGLKGATIPRIAARAGLTAGAVYRRFRDKDELLRTVILETLRCSGAQLRQAFDPALAEKYPLKSMAASLINGMVVSYRKNAGFLRAVRQFVLGHPSASFRRKVDELEFQTLRGAVDFLLKYRAQIHRPDPQAAIAFGLALVSFALNELILTEVFSSPWDPLFPKSDEELVQELTRAMLSYLGAESD